MIRHTRLVSIFLALAMLLSSVSSVVIAQDSAPQPDDQSIQPGELWKDPETDLWMRSNNASTPAVDNFLSTDGPDNYGYTWDDTVLFSWIDATDGTKAGLETNINGTELIPLPFAFKYYENTYTSLYITAFGYISFSHPDYWPNQFELPSPSIPNNLIAPNAVPIRLAESGSTNNQVYYKSGGVAPNRTFTTEWYQVDGYDGNIFTFEVILHENGDIVFQYQQMNYGSSYNCNSSGIEDSTGSDGLAYMGFCSILPSNKAVRFYRPTPGAHVKVNPLIQGKFTKIGQTDELKFEVTNIGEVGNDVFELSATSGWPVSGFYTESNEPLTDTNGNGSIDTGSLAERSSTTVKLYVKTPLAANIGDNNTAMISITSNLDPSRIKTIALQTAIPAPFAQVYKDYADRAMSIDLIQPTSIMTKKATPDGYNGALFAVAEMANGFIYLWEKVYWDGSNGSIDLEYSLLDKSGKIICPLSKLIGNSSSAYYRADESAAVAVLADGHIGVAWTRSLYANAMYQLNIFFAELDTSGNIVVSPTNVTQNSSWGNPNDLFYYSLKIAATQDNRFALVWQQKQQEANGVVDDIYYTILDNQGNSVKPVSKLTADTAGSEKDYRNPALTALTNNRVMLAWSAHENSTDSIALAILDSNGNVIANPSALSLLSTDLDMTQLSTGQILIAGSTPLGLSSSIFYTILNGNDYAQIAGPTTLNNPSAISGNAYISVTADLDGHGVLTWTDIDDYQRENLYYSLINSDGSVLTNPLIFISSQAIPPRLSTSYLGYGNTSYTLVTPTTSDVDLRLTAPAFSIGKSGSNVSITTTIQNLGLSLAGSVTLTATLDPSLTFIGSSLTPTSVSGNTITWNLPDLDFQGEGKMALELTLPTAARGTSYPINWTLTSTGTEANPDDNTGLTQVLIGEGVYLPLVLR